MQTDRKNKIKQLKQTTNFQHRDAGGRGYGQSLVSPGSCLEEFRVRPFIECHGFGTCNYYSTATSFWLTIIKDGDMFRRPIPQTLKTDHTSRVSRCAVCLRRRVTEDHRQDVGRVPRPFTPNGQREQQQQVGAVQYPYSQQQQQQQQQSQRYYPNYQYQRLGPVGRTRGPNRRVPYQYRRKGRLRKPERTTESQETVA